MAEDVILQLKLVDVYGEGLREKVDILLRHQVLHEAVKASANATNVINVTGLRGW